MKTPKPNRASAWESKTAVLAPQNQQLTSLSPDEKREFETHLEEIRAGFHVFFKVAFSIWAIWKKKLYRETHKSFEAFCLDVAEMSKAQAYRLIQAAEIYQCLSKIEGVMLPQSEAHIRPLIAVPRPKLAKVWQKFLNQSDGKKITARKIESFVSGFSPGKKNEKLQEQWKDRVLESLKKIKNSMKNDDIDEILTEIERMKINVEQIGGMGRNSRSEFVDEERRNTGI